MCVYVHTLCENVSIHKRQLLHLISLNALVLDRYCSPCPPAIRLTCIQDACVRGTNFGVPVLPEVWKRATLSSGSGNGSEISSCPVVSVSKSTIVFKGCDGDVSLSVESLWPTAHRSDGSFTLFTWPSLVKPSIRVSSIFQRLLSTPGSTASREHLCRRSIDTIRSLPSL